MIGFLYGKVAHRGDDFCLLEVSGVGYRLSCSATTLAALPPAGSAARLWTHLHVREDALALFGFATEAEQAVFEGLISVSGVGPKVALQVCSAYVPDALRRVLVSGDVAGLATVPGIGKKTASRIVLELKEKMSLPGLEVVGPETNGRMVEARSALENLGYSGTEVTAALAGLEPDPEAAIEEVVRAALRVLAEERRAR